MANFREKNFKNWIKRKIKGFFLKFGFEVKGIEKRGNENFPDYIDVSFVKIYKKYCHRSMVSWQGLYDNYLAAKHIGISSIEGEIVECGVFLGGSIALIKETIDLFSKSKNSRKYYLFDTFEGMSDPSQEDYKIFEKDSLYTISRFKKYKREDGSSNNCRGELDEVKKTLSISNDKLKDFHFIKGFVEETLSEDKNIPQKIALLRLDTDFYESTKIELETLFSRLVKGGILLIDDYGMWNGSKKATDEFFSKNNFKDLVILNNHANGSLIGIKI